jgi:hypothetical protein
MTTLIDFTPSATALFQFLAALSNGQQYTVSVPWNPFGERYYVTVSDLTNAVIVNRSLTQSGPAFRGEMDWDAAQITILLPQPHNVPIGELASTRISQTGTALDGIYAALAVDEVTLVCSLPTNPKLTIPAAGKVDFPLDLLAGYGIGALYFHADTQQFEF